jgi:microcin C transport system substrate-binding protein
MAAEGLPSQPELALLEPFRDRLNPRVFGEAYVPPRSDGSGQDRDLLRRANELLTAAGCKRQGSAMLLPDGSPFEIEILDFEVGMEPHAGAFIKNLKLLGIDARFRVVDAAQFQRRRDNFDYDMVAVAISGEVTPSDSMRFNWGSESAAMPGSQNFSGIADPVIDALIEKAIIATSRAELTDICRAIDRILRAGHYWIPMWNNPNHLLAYWDLFSRPEQNPKHAWRYVMSLATTWWYDEEKAKRIHFASR